MWVAPNSIAFSRLNSTGSTATIVLGAGHAGALHGVDADAADADDDDRVTGAHRRLGGRAPPGGDAARRPARRFQGRSSSTLIDRLSATTACSANVPTLADQDGLRRRRGGGGACRR